MIAQRTSVPKRKVTYSLEGLLLLLELGGGLGQVLLDLVQFVLNLLDLLLQSANFLLSLVQKYKENRN